ncbi:hypothetical protein BS50DRAFT_34111 [Corynespora cassiicola Philippines]|uniref:Uncharacterized protein n=1 Tax=Corynespora cassiicola Philippines TaxID=1448308 RepID=A0A2T2PCB5_CORCC|nr:hypothetical protein BS50DRAFT_34111 [Corynespora cassiicola Philippines]
MLSPVTSRLPAVLFTFLPPPSISVLRIIRTSASLPSAPAQRPHTCSPKHRTYSASMPFSDVDLGKHHVPAIIESAEPYVELPSPPLEFGPPPCPDIDEGLRQLTLRSPSPYELEEQRETSTEGNDDEDEEDDDDDDDDDEDLMDVDQLATTSANVSVPVVTAATTPAAVAVVADNLPGSIAAWKWLLEYEGTELYNVLFTKETADIEGVSDWISDVVWQDCLCGDRRLPLCSPATHPCHPYWHHKSTPLGDIIYQMMPQLRGSWATANFAPSMRECEWLIVLAYLLREPS